VTRPLRKFTHHPDMSDIAVKMLKTSYIAILGFMFEKIM